MLNILSVSLVGQDHFRIEVEDTNRENEPS